MFNKTGCFFISLAGPQLDRLSTSFDIGEKIVE